MIWLRLAIWCYVLGLFTFYLYAAFGTRAWDIAYFGWSKLADCGILFWTVLYVNHYYRPKVKWLFYFSFVRFAWDIQTFFTGIGVNNHIGTAVLFLILLILTAIMTLKEDRSRPNG